MLPWSNCKLKLALGYLKKMYSTNRPVCILWSGLSKNNWTFLNLNVRPALQEQNFYYKLSFYFQISSYPSTVLDNECEHYTKETWLSLFCMLNTNKTELFYFRKVNVVAVQ